MLADLERSAVEQFCGVGETWLVLPEHEVHGRIPDLVLARVDVSRLEQRLRHHGWSRRMQLGELRVLRALRPDRATSSAVVSTHLRMPPNTCTGHLRSLVSSGFVEATATGGFLRVAELGSILDYVISFEAKLSDVNRALIQARSHSSFADRSYVALAPQKRSFAKDVKSMYRSTSIGLFELSGPMWKVDVRPKRSRLFSPVMKDLAGEAAFGRLLGEPTKTLPESRLPHALVESANPMEPALVGPIPRGLKRHLAVATQRPFRLGL